MATKPASQNPFPELLLAEVAAPAAAPSGKVRLYAKADGLLYWKDDAGTEYPIGADISAHTGDTSDAHDASAISIVDAGAIYTGTDVEAALQEVGGSAAAHLADTSDAHDASAISFAPAGTIAATTVQAAIEEVAAEAGGGGGLTLPTVVQMVTASHGAGGLAMTIAQPATTSLLVWIACQNGGAAVPSLTNWTWTQLFTDNVGGVGNLTIYTGVYAGSGTPGTSITTSGGGGLSGAMLVELANATLVGNGSGTLRAQTLSTNGKQSDSLVPQDVGSLIAFLVHTAGTAGSASPILHGAIPLGKRYDSAAQPLMFGVSVGARIMGSYHPSASSYTLAEIRISY